MYITLRRAFHSQAQLIISRISSFVYHTRRHADTDADVSYEKVRLLKMSGEERKNKALYCENMAKYFWKTPAVEQTYFAVDRGECFGLLGVNGSGKSTLIKLLAGVEKLSFGNCLVYGSNVGKATVRVVGYCPEHNPFLQEFTSSEVLKILCLLFGVPTHLIPGICENLAKLLGLYPHYKKRISTLGSGARRRLSCAVAMLGQPSILLLDNPTSSIDPAGRRLLWNLIGQMCTRGVAVMVSTLSPQEAEMICNRTAVISGGIMQCLGKPYYLTDKYAKGYVLKVKVRDVYHSYRQSIVPGGLGTEKPFIKLLSFMALEFPDCHLRDQRGNCLYFSLPLEGNTSISISDTMQRNALMLKVEDFTVTRNNLAIAFVEIAEHAYRAPAPPKF